MKTVLLMLTLIGCLIPSLASAESGFYLQPAFTELRGVVNVGPADAIGTTSLQQHGVGLVEGQPMFGLALQLSALESVRLGVGWSTASQLARVANGVELDLGAGWSFDMIDVGVSGQYLINPEQACEHGWPKSDNVASVSGFSAIRSKHVMFQISGGAHFFTPNVDCGEEGNTTHVAYFAPKLAVQVSDSLGLALQTRLPKSRREIEVHPKLEAVVSRPLETGVLDISVSLEVFEFELESTTLMAGLAYRV